MAMMSSKRSGFSLRRLSRMPAPSSWNTPTVSAAGQQLVGLRVVERAAAPGRASMPRPRLTSSTAFSSTVSVFRPRKSNFTRPAASTIFQLNWVSGKLDSRIAVERHQLVERPVADHHAGGVGRGVAIEALELLARFRAGVATIGSLSRASCSLRLAVDGLRRASPDWPDCWAPACTAGRPGRRASAARGRRRAARRAPAACRR